MTLYMESSPGVFEIWSGQPIGGIRYPLNWDRDDLKAKGLIEPVEPAVPAGQHVVTSTVQRVAGVVQYVYTLADDDEDRTYPPLEKYQFQAVLDLLGLREPLMAALTDLAASDPTFAAVAKAKVTDPPGGIYYRSDALFHNNYLQMRLGMTDADINALWVQARAL